MSLWDQLIRGFASVGGTNLNDKRRQLTVGQWVVGGGVGGLVEWVVQRAMNVRKGIDSKLHK